MSDYGPIKWIQIIPTGYFTCILQRKKEVMNRIFTKYMGEVIT